MTESYGKHHHLGNGYRLDLVRIIVLDRENLLATDLTARCVSGGENGEVSRAGAPIIHDPLPITTCRALNRCCARHAVYDNLACHRDMDE
jgi:hypothetical protein